MFVSIQEILSEIVFRKNNMQIVPHDIAPPAYAILQIKQNDPERDDDNPNGLVPCKGFAENGVC